MHASSSSRTSTRRDVASKALLLLDGVQPGFRVNRLHQDVPSSGGSCASEQHRRAAACRLPCAFVLFRAAEARHKKSHQLYRHAQHRVRGAVRSKIRSSSVSVLVGSESTHLQPAQSRRRKASTTSTSSSASFARVSPLGRRLSTLRSRSRIHRPRRPPPRTRVGWRNRYDQRGVSAAQSHTSSALATSSTPAQPASMPNASSSAVTLKSPQEDRYDPIHVLQPRGCVLVQADYAAYEAG